MLQKRLIFSTMLFLLLLMAVGLGFGQNGEKEYGVYEYVVESAQGTFEDISNAIESNVVESGWRLLAKVDAGVPKDCALQARVFVLFDADYAEQIMKANSKTGAFAVVDRINLFEDENGIHVAVVNPHSINRTVLMDDVTYEQMTEVHLQALRKLIATSVQGSESQKQFGQLRKEGFIGKTMGVMAGGDFGGKVEDVITVEGGDLKEVAAKVGKGLGQPSKKWGMHLAFELALPEYDTVVFGTTGTPMDSKSFDIVKAGADESRKSLECPGLAHAAAYPMAVVVVKEGDDVQIRLVETMYRMKMYFEDAGKWAFMKNMRMPGSIYKEVRKQVKAGLKEQGGT